MAEENNTPLTEKNAAFVACQKVATADVVAGKYSKNLSEGTIVHEDIGVYLVVVPIDAKMNFKNDLERFLYIQDTAKNNKSMREHANIKEHDYCYAVSQLNAQEIETAIRALQVRNEFVETEISEKPESYQNLIVITERHT